MIVALAGRRIDAEGSESERFPLTNVGLVKEKLKALLISLKPQVLISSAACGSDLIALQVAGELNIRRSIVLPFSQAAFKLSSVIDRPGDWGNLFDTICLEVSNEEKMVERNYPQNDDETYRKANLDILERAKILAEKFGSLQEMVAIVVWEGKPKSENDTTEHFKKNAEARHFTIQEIITV